MTTAILILALAFFSALLYIGRGYWAWVGGLVAAK